MYGTDKVATAQFDPLTNSTSLLADYDETTNNFAYTDLVDCLTNAVNLIKRFKPELIDWFENIEYLHETYNSSPVDNNDLE